MPMKTYLPKVDEIERKWLVVDAEEQILGRLAVKIANVLRGRHKPTYTPHLDCGDFVVVVNAEKVFVSGNKETQKEYQDYSGYMGGRKVQTLDEVRARKPERIIRDAVWGMMPKGRLGRSQFRKLRIYTGPEHPHEAQQVEAFAL
ncbi:MAG: 50S ribosomal protein L13 [Lentisphaerae bacterium]|jgi:large subunit ribosomal protein L13|nr:50S ribosomal protein L13 [Lentisphaerota bacterium]MBT4815343.1 50S ribosomal protein L13 [Lentisphaerota bacterium]MBT5610121.1 50S ribosomal protein L13 [Lentisphaerota bacterium]MBT7053587.1 50S ribosomal protein L13 [Lentisphaerota bacterium]MBT7842109.1 50S ribosomal protein L13 [Lentisphaerota bacterium]